MILTLTRSLSTRYSDILLCSVMCNCYVQLSLLHQHDKGTPRQPEHHGAHDHPDIVHVHGFPLVAIQEPLHQGSRGFRGDAGLGSLRGDGF